jgi:hypothetical protein
MTNMNTLEAIDHAAKQDANWLLIFGIVCLGAALGWFTKWAIGRFDATTAAFQASMEKHNAALLVVIGDQKAQHQQSIDTVARNTVAIEQITKTLEYCRARNGERT